MENTTEDDVSSMGSNHSSFSSSSVASGESGWTTYIDYFMETQQQLQQKGATGACTATPSTNDIGRSTSEHIGGHGGAGGAMASFTEASRLLPALVDPLQVLKRLSFRKEEGIRRKQLMYDESLKDTATSPISSPKLVDSRDSGDKYKNKDNGCDEISHFKNTTDELDFGKHTINDNGAKSRINDDAYGHNELRKNPCVA